MLVMALYDLCHSRYPPYSGLANTTDPSTGGCRGQGLKDPLKVGDHLKTMETDRHL